MLLKTGEYTARWPRGGVPIAWNQSIDAISSRMK